MTDMREVLPDNPATRLLNILHKAININSNETDLSGNIWAKVLNVGIKPDELFPAYAQLFILTEDAYEAVTKFYPRQQNIHNKWRQELTKCLQTNSLYHHKWSSVASQLRNPEIKNMLEVAEDNLAHHVMRTSVDELSIQKLKEEFEELKAKISDEKTFSSQLQSFLIKELEKILNALEHFDLNGSSPIRESIYGIISNKDLADNREFSFNDQLCKFLLVAATTISIVNDIAVLPANLTLLKERLIHSSEISASPNTPTKPNLPKELAVFRNEEAEPISD